MAQPTPEGRSSEVLPQYAVFETTSTRSTMGHAVLLQPRMLENQWSTNKPMVGTARDGTMAV